MKIISYTELLQYAQNIENLDNVAAISVTNNHLYLDGWTENSPDYNVKLARKPINRPTAEFKETDTITSFFENSHSYQSPMSTVTKNVTTPCETLYDATNKTATILILPESELYDVIHILKNGMYILYTIK